MTSRHRFIAIATFAVILVSTSLTLRASEKEWVEVRTPNSIVASNAGGAVATSIATQLEFTREAIRHLAGDSMREPGEPVVVLAVKNQGGIKELLPQYWERRGPKPAGAASPGPYTPYIALRTNVRGATRARLLAHEYLHILVRATVPDPPAWLDEGLADFWASVRVEDGVVKVGEARRDHLGILKSGDWIPLQDLLKIERGRYPANSRRLRLQYAQSWALVHYLLLGRPGAVLTFAPNAPEGSLPALERDLREYVKGRLPLVEKPFTAADSQAAAAAPLSLARSLALRGLFLVHGERPAAALPLLNSALAGEPTEPSALEGLGTYYFLSNDHDEARRWFKHAVGGVRPSYRVHYYYGLLMQDQAEIAEFHLRKALELNPGFAPALERLKKAPIQAESTP